VNNRDLKTFQVELTTAERLAPRISAKTLKVAESGIHSGEDMARLHASGFNVFLIGESLITKPSPGEALKNLLHSARSLAAATPAKS
jgi:indole-3-glycerol phosphate synthase